MLRRTSKFSSIEARQPPRIPAEQRLARRRRQARDAPHAADDLFVAAVEPLADVVVEHLGRLAEALMVRDVERRQQRRIERLVPVARQPVDDRARARG